MNVSGLKRVRGALNPYWELIGQVVVILNCLGLTALAEWLWPQFNWRAFTAIGGIAGGSLAILELQLLDRIAGRHVRVFALDTTFDKVVWSMFALVIVVAIVIGVWEFNQDAAAVQTAREIKAKRDELNRQLNSPRSQRAFQVMRDHQAMKQHSSASRPATAPASRRAR
jgi:hypothetical protein